MNRTPGKTNWSERDVVRIASLLTDWVFATKRRDPDRQAELSCQLELDGVTVIYRQANSAD